MMERLPDNFADWPRLASLGPIATARSYAEIAQHQDDLYARRRPQPATEGGRVIVSKPQHVDAVRAAADWVKSSRSDNSGPYCVELAKAGEVVAVRDSKNPHGPVLVFTPDEFGAFLAGAKDGEFDHLI